MSETDREPYVSLIGALPRPTPAQTEQFVTHVAGAHSWYKHLPLYPPGAPFVVFLDPDAGRSLISTPSGELAFADRTEESERFHYTWMTTPDYRERFGHWQYHCGRSPFFMRLGPASQGREVLSSRARVLDSSGDWLAVPNELARAGTCHLTGLVHDWFRLRTQPDPFRETLIKAGVHDPFHVPQWLFSQRKNAGFVEFARQNPDHPEISRYLPFLELVENYRELRYRRREEALARVWRQMQPFFESECGRQRGALCAALENVLSVLGRLSQGARPEG